MDFFQFKKVKPEMTFDINKLIKQTRDVISKVDKVEVRMDRFRETRLKDIRAKIVAIECKGEENCSKKNIEEALKKYTIEFKDEHIKALEKIKSDYDEQLYYENIKF